MIKIYTLIFIGFASLQINAQCYVFNDNFESGTLSTAFQQIGVTAPSITNAAPAQGTYCLSYSGNGNTSHFNGLMTTFAASTPTQVSLFMKTSNNSVANGYFVLGDNNVTTNNGVIWLYFDGTGTLRLYVSSVSEVNIPVNNNEWHFVEFKNMNYVTHTFDFWVDGTLYATSFPFRFPSNNLTRFHLYNFNNGATGYYDDIRIAAQPITTSISGTDVTCYGAANGTIDLTASSVNSGTLTYQWSNGATTEDPATLAPGGYNVTITDGAGCTQTNTIVIEEPAEIIGNITGTDVTCFGGSDGTASVSATNTQGPVSFLWSNGDTPSAVSGLEAGMTTVVITDSIGCSIVDTIMIGEPAQMVGNIAGTDVTCFGDSDGTASVSPTNTQGPVSFLWSNGDTPSTVSGLEPGIITVVITDSVGCSIVDTIMIGEPGQIVISPSVTDVLCYNAANGIIDISVTGGTGSYSYVWSTGAISDNISGLATGSYSVSVTDAVGCNNVSTIDVTSPNPILGNGLVTDQTSLMNLGSIDFSVTGGTAPYTYNWSNGATTEDLSDLSGGTYTVTITDANGCEEISTFTVNNTNALEGQELIKLTFTPNPTEGFVHISAEGMIQAQISVLDVGGRLVFSIANIDATNFALNITDQPQGVYFVKLKQDEKQVNFRIVKK